RRRHTTRIGVRGDAAPRAAEPLRVPPRRDRSWRDPREPTRPALRRRIGAEPGARARGAGAARARRVSHLRRAGGRGGRRTRPVLPARGPAADRTAGRLAEDAREATRAAGERA